LLQSVSSSHNRIFYREALSLMEDSSKWELEPANAHPTARGIMTQDFYWDCTDENSPFGNDTGADVLTFFREQWQEAPGTVGLAFLSDLLAGWEVADRAWEIVDAQEVERLLEEDEFSFSHRDDSILSLAFAQLLFDGRVSADVRERALTSLIRQKTEAALSLWPTEFHDERRSRVEIMQHALQSAPS
jgi:uncharacterized protein YfeS